jgi:hypothetical protein
MRGSVILDIQKSGEELVRKITYFENRPRHLHGAAG